MVSPAFYGKVYSKIIFTVSWHIAASNSRTFLCQRCHDRPHSLSRNAVGFVIVLDLKNELIRWIACLADIQKARYFAWFHNIGVAGGL